MSSFNIPPPRRLYNRWTSPSSPPPIHSFQETPIIERPIIERPRIERPRIERPRIERPRIERPRIERPRIERPRIERPRIERPRIERPRIERPRIERPRIERPRIERPRIERPRIRTPSPIQSINLNVSYEDVMELMSLFAEAFFRDDFDVDFWDSNPRVYLTYHPKLCNYKEPEPEPIIINEYYLFEPDFEPDIITIEPESEPNINQPDSEPIN